MPSLAPQPNDALYNRLADLERRMTEVTTLRRRPSPICKMVERTPQAFGSGVITKVDLVSNVQPAFDTAGMADDTNHEIVIPSRGVYHQVAFIPCFSGADQLAAAYFYVNGSAVYQDCKFQFVASETGDGGKVFEAYSVLDEGWSMSLRLFFATHSTGAVSASNQTIAYTVARVSDIPAGISP